MINTVLEALLFFLPAGIANMTPIFINKIPGVNTWNTPLDFGKTFRGKRIFGDNKRWRGLTNGTLAGGLSALLLEKIASEVTPFANTEQALIAGVALGAGALFGDAIESFFKRQAGVKPGDSWFPFDQTDYIIGGLVAVSFVTPASIETLLWIFLLYFGLHLVASYCGYLLGLKDKPI